ncbi:EscU/YscU/HrcU family type III secretion system export apparatus switch protein [Arsenophonus endosymbiont of Aleurodicus floccissimus]|uniref:EscU/YscU/HrcU family type III secretion system export apparatus switch protein n=1 Tax=Arsenophonus endosymbiont of Aleurodicus floccissimus TaxID=2152761 RepID=UPI000E6B19FF|nr:EscU/YscU/HrcU family type III secretion system export apparatus switch protein [Arsenophonus endosymbiont of Aleurodicus floccissimus]
MENVTYRFYRYFIIVLILDSVAEYFIHVKDLKMDKNEVKREHKEQEGNPEIKLNQKEKNYMSKFYLNK